MRRRAALRQEEINAPRNTGAGRRQTAKQEEKTRNENRAKVRRLHLALGEQTNRAEIRACGALTVERPVQRTVRRQQPEREQQRSQQTSQRWFRDSSQIADGAFQLHDVRINHSADDCARAISAGSCQRRLKLFPPTTALPWVA